MINSAEGISVRIDAPKRKIDHLLPALLVECAPRRRFNGRRRNVCSLGNTRSPCMAISLPALRQRPRKGIPQDGPDKRGP